MSSTSGMGCAGQRSSTGNQHSPCSSQRVSAFARQGSEAGDHEAGVWGQSDGRTPEAQQHLQLRSTRAGPEGCMGHRCQGVWVSGNRC